MSAEAPTPAPARRRWSQSRFFNDVVLAVMVGLVVAGVNLSFLEWRNTQRMAEGQRLENLRHVREASAAGNPEGRLFANLDLAGLPLAGLDLSEADLRSSVLDDAILDGTDLAGADLSGASLSEARLVDADLSGVRATCRDIDDEEDPVCVDFTEALMQGADLTGANLSGADLSETDLQRTTLTDVVHSCGQETRWPEGFSPPSSAPCP